jgi:hypothetical protein
MNSDKAIIIGTGPSLNDRQLDLAIGSGLPTFGVNLVYQKVPQLDVLLSCNPEWWDYYMENDPSLSAHPCEKWTWDKDTSEKYDLKYIEGRWGDGLSTDPSYIHYGHSSGFQIINLAYHMGVREFILIGYDMKYGEGYNRAKRHAGSERHFFGEYPDELLHWPKVGEDNEFTGLLREYEKITQDVRIVNCSPGTALTCFEVGELENNI